MRELYEYNDRLWEMKSRIDKGSDWSDERENILYVKLHFNVPFHCIVVGISCALRSTQPLKMSIGDFS